jgi:Holliday junction resolvase-like predicted endonuclease
MESTSFEDIKQIMREVAEMQKETNRMFKETNLQFKETDRRFKETDLKFKELFEVQKGIARGFEETKQLVDKLCGKLGNIETNIGYAVETYFYTALTNSLTFGNIRFDDVIPNLKKEHRGASCEFDLVMVNHEAIAIIEVKHRIHPSLPEEMATRKVKQFRKFFPEYKNHRLYLGIAGLSMDEAVVENARDLGVGVLKQDGDTIEAFDVPLKAY